MSVNQLLSEDGGAIIGVIDPDAYVAGEQLTAAIDMSKWEQVEAILLLGDRTAGTTVTFTIKASATSGGSYAAITGKTATAIADESPLSGASNKQVIINLRGEEVTSNNQYVKASVTISSVSPSGVDFAVVVIGRGRIKPSSDNDLASVKQIVQ